MKLHKGINYPQQIKTQTLMELPNLIPDEGEMITVSGGLGNRTLKQTKKEDGVYYERDNEEREWKVLNMGDKILNFLSKITY
ncbi:hypothetical protein [Niallia circulans]|uniref:hypothetical protein n=1 Tax=Niallia circulans TaxID=1397 RepID=UPI0026EA2F43|nr:hypothetical protein [Niallia circulans]